MEKIYELLLGSSVLQWIAISLIAMLTIMFVTFFVQYNIDRANGKHAKFLWFEVNDIPKPSIEQPDKTNPLTSIHGKNINTGTNLGSIGDQYVGLKQREITKNDIEYLKDEIHNFSQKHSEKILKSHITVGHPHCKETSNLAKKIYTALQEMGFNNIRTISLHTHGAIGKKFEITNAPDNSIMVAIYPPDNVE
ncbi:hypothetical protein ACLIN3_09290 [Pseudomonas orientalis]|uniref:hypothetical protein n=1 Tax=Pseudomonas orientalis TaxID=76758 RepID=UPI00398831DC